MISVPIPVPSVFQVFSLKVAEEIPDDCVCSQMQLSPALAQRIDKVRELTQNCQMVPDLQALEREHQCQTTANESLGARENLLHFLCKT